MGREILCELFNVPIHTLPTIVPTTGDFGAIATKNGNIPVTASVVDQQAALYGFGCREPGDAKITFGTGAFALMITGDKIHRQPDHSLLPTVAWQKQGQKPIFALDGGIYTASAAVNWAKTLGLFSEFSEINSFYSPPAIEAGLVFVPALSGIACPHWNPRARGMWLDLSIEHRPEQLVQAILEGVAFRAGEVIETMKNCRELSGAILVDGGMSKNPYFVQFLADILEREVRPAHIPELTGLGTIQLAADITGYTPINTSQFGSFLPQSNRNHSKSLFRKAVDMSLQWNNASHPHEALQGQP